MKQKERLARGLGWFSIGLGIAEIVAPRALARLVGVQNHRVLPGLGVREIASGLGILSGRYEAEWVWSRVAGDAMDLAILSENLSADNPGRNRACCAAAAVATVGALDIVCARQLSSGGGSDDAGPERKGNNLIAKSAVTIERTPEELYAFWRRLENLPQIMTQLESVEELDGGRSRWRAKAPANKTVEWVAEITEERPGEFIAWRSIEGSQVNTSGSIRFAPAAGGRGTMVQVQMRYNPPGGAIGAALSTLFGENPDRQLYDALRAFKQVMEVGEVTRSEGTVLKEAVRQRPAQPIERARAA